MSAKVRAILVTYWRDEYGEVVEVGGIAQDEAQMMEMVTGVKRRFPRGYLGIQAMGYWIGDTFPADDTLYYFVREGNGTIKVDQRTGKK